MKRLLEQDLREIQLLAYDSRGRLGTLRTSLDATGNLALTDFAPIPQTSGVSTPNQIRNGDFSHSVNTWNESVASAGDKSKECAWWYSHDAPGAGQQLDKSTSFADLNVDGDANVATNKTLKEATHSTYNAAFADWDRGNGIARMTGLKSLDAPFPSNTATPGRTMCVPFILALKDSTIVVPDGCLLGAGVWDNTAGQRDWLKASAAFNFLSGSGVEGTPAVTTERRYKIFAKTDRGYTFLSQELTIAAAPTDASFVPNSVYVFLAWQPIVGVLEYHVYRRNVTAGTYDLLEKIGNGATTYLDQNAVDTAGVAGYPTATDDRAKAYVASRPGDLARIAVNGVDPSWSTFFLNVPVPGGSSGYNQGNTTGDQWLRFALTQALDRRVADGVVSNGSPTLTSATALFTALDTGRTATVTKGANSVTVTLTYVNPTTVTMSANWTFANAANATVYITGGGDHGLLLDLVMVSYVPNAVFAHNPDDLNRPQQPNAAPNGSTQGGIGDGGAGEGSGEGGGRGKNFEQLPV